MKSNESRPLSPQQVVRRLRIRYAPPYPGKTLGQGTFGKVILARHKITGENAAIKVLEKSKISDTSDTERVLREIHILKLMRHPNIVQLYDIGETNKKLFLFMEYMENGELFNYIVENERLRED